MAAEYCNPESNDLDSFFSPAVLGELEYDDDGQAWLLEFGYAVAEYEYSCTYDSSDLKGQADGSIKRINNFMRQNINGITIQCDLGIEQCIAHIRRFLKAIHKNKSYALFLISCCSWYLSKSSMVDKSDSERVSKLKEKAESHLRELKTSCQDIEINQSILLNALNRKLSRRGGIYDLRELLQRLSKPVKVLLISADPKDTATTRLDDERRALRLALREADFRHKIKVKNIHGCRIDDVQGALNHHKPDILHFIGHGDKSGLYFEDRDNKAKLVPMKALADVLKQCKTIKLVILSTCHSRYEGQCIADAVGSLIGMEGAIRNKDAIAFTKDFYTALGAGCEIQESLNQAAANVMLDIEAVFRAHLLRRGLEPYTAESSVQTPVGWIGSEHRGIETSVTQWLLLMIIILFCVCITAFSFHSVCSLVENTPNRGGGLPHSSAQQHRTVGIMG